MVYSQNSFHINSTLAFKTITISNGKEVILTANKISSIFKNLLEMYDYEVQVHQTMNLPFIVWVAIFKGIHLLIRR